MKKIRILSFVIAIFMLCTMLAACDEGSKTVMKVDGKNISKDIFTATVSYMDMTIEQSFGVSLATMLDEDMGDGTTGAQFLKSQSENFIIEAEAIRMLADENGVGITAEDKDLIKETKDKEIEAAGGRKEFVEALESQGINEAFYDYMTESVSLYSKVQTELFTGDGKYAPTAESIAESFGGDYLCVKHVLIAAEQTDPEYAAKKAEAEKVAQRAKAGEDFDALIAEFGEDPGMQSSKGGYIMDSMGLTPSGGAMIQEFADASAALGVGEVSDVVPSSYGFHIIKRYPMSAEHIATDLEGFAAQVGTGLFTQILTEKIEAIKVEYTKEYENIDIHTILESEKTIGSDAGVAADPHAGHDHSAEGGEVPEITLTPAE